MPPRRVYSEEEITAGLLELCLWAGNATQASRTLKVKGHEIPESTLRSWKDRFAQRYVEMHSEKTREVEKLLIAQAHDTAVLAHDVEKEALEVQLRRLKGQPGKVKDPSAVAKNAATVKGIAIDKANALLGRPNVILDVSTGDDILANLQKRFPGLVDVVEGEVVEPEQIEAHAGL